MPGTRRAADRENTGSGHGNALAKKAMHQDKAHQTSAIYQLCTNFVRLIKPSIMHRFGSAKTSPHSARAV